MCTCISCQHLQAWAGAYRGGRPPTACYYYYVRHTDWDIRDVRTADPSACGRRSTEYFGSADWRRIFGRRKCRLIMRFRSLMSILAYFSDNQKSWLISIFFSQKWLLSRYICRYSVNYWVLSTLLNHRQWSAWFPCISGDVSLTSSSAAVDLYIAADRLSWSNTAYYITVVLSDLWSNAAYWRGL